MIIPEEYFIQFNSTAVAKETRPKASFNNMAKGGKEPATVNFVHQNDILCETIRKEQKNQKLYTSYSINPFKKSK